MAAVISLLHRCRSVDPAPCRGVPKKHRAGEYPAEPAGDGDQGSDLATDGRHHEN